MIFETGFTPPSITSEPEAFAPYKITAREDGGVTLVGPFTAVNGSPRPGIASFEADGTLLAEAVVSPLSLANFTYPEFSFPVAEVAASLPAGKQFVTGTFTGVNGVSRPDRSC